MKTTCKLLAVTFILGALVFARDIKKNPRVVEKRAVNDHYIIKDQYHDDDKQLDRKRSHKRRRKIRKPLKGLR